MGECLGGQTYANASTSVLGPKRSKTNPSSVCQGTSYTITNLERITGTTTATNYARDIAPNVPVHPNWINGPFLHKPVGRSVPAHVLTKTHCGGYCMDCAMSGYYLPNASQFERSCRTGNQWGGNTTVYDDSHSPKITKAVHLIRNPFDNLVGRAHLGSQHRVERGESAFNHTPEGLNAWCYYLDTKYAKESRQNAQLFDLDLPCHAEWFRYIQWHNHAVEVTSQFQSVLHLYYTNYTTNYDATIHELLNFLQLSIVQDPIPFATGKAYLDYFSTEHQRRAAHYVRKMASPATWRLLAHFFEPTKEPTDGDNDGGNQPGSDDEVSREAMYVAAVSESTSLGMAAADAAAPQQSTQAVTANFDEKMALQLKEAKQIDWRYENRSEVVRNASSIKIQESVIETTDQSLSRMFYCSIGVAHVVPKLGKHSLIEGTP